MTRDELEHAIRAACEITNDDEVYVFGSQAILGQFPNAPKPLRLSAEVDISPKHQISRIEWLNSIGEDSPFHRQFGFYVHGIPILEAAVLPKNWALRTVPICNPNTSHHTAYCLEAHDLAVSKLAAFREKDREFVRVLLAGRFVSPRKLVARIRLLPIDDTDRKRLLLWTDRTVRELRPS